MSVEPLAIQPLKVICLESLLNSEFPEEVFIGGGLLCRYERMLLAADSKAGKSTLLTQILRCLSEGKPFLGFEVPKARSVLFMQAELREKRLKDRMTPTGKLLSQEAQRLFQICSTEGLIMFDDSKDLDRVKKTLDIVKPDVLTIDPMANFHMSDENSSRDMMMFLRILDRLKADFNLSIIMSTHFRKGAQTGSIMEMIRGSGALKGWADTNICIEGHQGDKSQHLEFELRNSDDIHKRILFYNRDTKSFDWKDTLRMVINWTIEILSLEDMPTNKFVQSMIVQCGDYVSSNRTKAYKMKETLVSKGVILEFKNGKVHLLRLNPMCIYKHDTNLDSDTQQQVERGQKASPSLLT